MLVQPVWGVGTLCPNTGVTDNHAAQMGLSRVKDLPVKQILILLGPLSFWKPPTQRPPELS